MKRALLVAIGAHLLAALVYGLSQYSPKPSPNSPSRPPPRPARSQILIVEEQLSEQDCMLARLSTKVPYGTAVVRYALPQPAELAGFYLRNTRLQRARVFQQLAGKSHSPGRFSVYPSAIVSSAPGGPGPSIVAEGEGWELFEVIPAGGAAAATRSTVHEFHVVDGFMRNAFGGADGWSISTGRWQLNQYGGGLADSNTQKTNADFQRAVNPFSVIASANAGESAMLVYDTPVSHGDSYLAEASFYFGSPSKPSDTGALKKPIPTFLVAQGELDGPQVGFGWWAEKIGAPARWSLCYRLSDQPWSALKSWTQRPPRCTWVRAGVAIDNGHVAVAMLDGRELGRCELDKMIDGSFHIHTGLDGLKIELDDVAARPLVSRDEDYGQPVYVRSKTFSEKALYGRDRDPEQFDQWAKAANTYVTASGTDTVLGLSGRRATLRMPLFGDFTYRSTPELPNGDYRFIALTDVEPKTVDASVADFTFSKTAAGWQVPADQSPPAFTLEFGRRNGNFVVKDGKNWKPLDASYNGPMHLMIVSPSAFEPDQHRIYSKCTWNELFEQSPSGWYWDNGMFGMNIRWACQENWNFMAGKSHNLAAMFSKAAYYGDQEIDCFMALSAVLPGARQYYIRRDLCVSFCTDGRNLDSGYTLMFAAEHNTKTVLLKRGQEIASTTDPRFLMPKGGNHGQVHWLWWNFDLKKMGDRIVVKYNGATMFDVTDPDPIEGGHIAFWTIGTGFVLSRTNIAAEKRVDHPAVALDERANKTHAWEPLDPDSVVIRKVEGGVEVRNPIGGGTFAARTQTQVDLSKTPVLELPMRLDPDAKINLHIEIDGRPWLVRVSAPVREMEYLLTPTADNVFPFGRPVMNGRHLIALVLGDATPQNNVLRFDLGGMLKRKGLSITGTRQITLTFGNSSNAGYLLAGFWGNHAGTTYCLGDPKWTTTGQ
ncbi:MAG: hypothetical protein HQ592_08875 [Planctomycetes bacterium]|nr:hypothetical protein [Planctomycetota bacterium]